MKKNCPYVVIGLLMMLQSAVVAQDQPMITPADCNYIIISYRLDGAQGIYIYFGNNKVDLVMAPNGNLNKLNNKNMGMSSSGNVISCLVDLLNRYDKEGFDMITSSTYAPINSIVGSPNSVTTTQYVLKRRAK